MKVAMSVGYVETVWNVRVQHAQSNWYCFQNI